MKRISSILYSLFAAVLVACTGNVDDSILPILKAEPETIDLAIESEVRLIVTFNGTDVTSESEITGENAVVTDGIFVPRETGKYTFTAKYAGLESKPVEVNVTNSKPEVQSVFNKHVSVIEFTGAWCTNCPAGYRSMEQYFNLTPAYKEKSHIVAFHTNDEGTDDLAIEATGDIHKAFKNGTLGYPSYVVDLRDCGHLNMEEFQQFTKSVKESFASYHYCGVAVSSVLDGAEAEVTVKVTSEFTTSYRVIVIVVEDKIRYYQKDGMMTDEDYVHRHVARKVVTEYGDIFAGEQITEDGMIAAGAEAQKTWKVAVDPEWNLENVEIYALVQDATGEVNNMNVCAIDGGDSEYDYKK